MKTELHDFCSQFSSLLEPLGDALGQGLKILEDQPDKKDFQSACTHLREVDHQLGGLQKKINLQQSYLLIFGPLKSGKSTLMNAISGAYVSEVSSLPAYPAMVYVNHGEKKKFSAKNYNGTVHEYKDEFEMAENIQRAHCTLAERLLEVEQRGDTFDPAEHMADSIRRIDVELPAENLRDSGMALVDTPGLYSRMKFGYDLMTREFRDTAACAIFVVKSDNLFFDKVFEEFNQLLDCFTRIFLVANIDSGKKDLTPDGQLVPALESRSPGEIVKAFESLSMSAPLREAHEQGRLSVYTIDLLRAAQEQILATRRNAEPEVSNESENEDDESTRSSGFDTFLSDLTDYLNSSDYLQDFISDSLRSGRNLAAEAAHVIRDDVLAGVKRQCDSLRPRHLEIEARLRSLNLLSNLDWDTSFDHLYSEKERLVNEVSRKYSQQISEKLGAQVDHWYHRDSSWNDLVLELNREVETAVAADWNAMVTHLKKVVSGANGGAQLNSETIEALQQANLSPEKIADDLAKALDEAKRPDIQPIALPIDTLPIKRGFWDIICLRSEEKLRRQLFGESGEVQIMSETKERRFTQESIDNLRATVKAYPEKELPTLLKARLGELINHYVSEFVKTIAQQIAELKKRAEQRLGESQRVIDEKSSLEQRLGKVVTECERLENQAKDLGERYIVQPSVPTDSTNDDTSEDEPLMVDFGDFDEEATEEEMR